MFTESQWPKEVIAGIVSTLLAEGPWYTDIYFSHSRDSRLAHPELCLKKHGPSVHVYLFVQNNISKHIR